MNVNSINQTNYTPNINNTQQSQKTTPINNTFSSEQNSQATLNKILNALATLIQQLLNQLKHQQEHQKNCPNTEQQATQQIGRSNQPITEQPASQQPSGQTLSNLDDGALGRIQRILREDGLTPNNDGFDANDIFDTDGDGKISAGDKINITTNILDGTGNVTRRENRIETLTQEQVSRFEARANGTSTPSGTRNCYR